MKWTTALPNVVHFNCDGGLHIISHMAQLDVTAAAIVFRNTYPIVTDWTILPRGYAEDHAYPLRHHMIEL